MLVRGQNNVDMWGHNSDRASIVVCDESPFDIEVVQPKVRSFATVLHPLIVKCTRKPEFKEAIRLRVLYAPPVYQPRVVCKFGDKSEVELPITANGNAAIGTFPITVLARCKLAKGGDMWMASEFINLEVA